MAAMTRIKKLGEGSNAESREIGALYWCRNYCNITNLVPSELIQSLMFSFIHGSDFLLHVLHRLSKRRAVFFRDEPRPAHPVMHLGCLRAPDSSILSIKAPPSPFMYT